MNILIHSQGTDVNVKSLKENKELTYKLPWSMQIQAFPKWFLFTVEVLFLTKQRWITLPNQPKFDK